MHKFPTQRPTPLDLELWKRALQKISSNFFVLAIQLQEYTNKPHEMPLWTTNADGLILHNTILQDDGEYNEVYIPCSNLLTRKTQSGQCFNLKIVVDGQSEFQSYAKHHPFATCNKDKFSSIPHFPCISIPYPYLDLSKLLRT
jgi:hypothetical protein